MNKYAHIYMLILLCHGTFEAMLLLFTFNFNYFINNKNRLHSLYINSNYKIEIIWKH